nr:60S ribosomal protein L34 [Tanacetum cinerariifolium]
MGHFSRDCRVKGNQDNRRRDDGYNGNKTRNNGRRHAYQDDSKALVTIDGEDIDWFGHVEEEAQNYAMMAYSSSNSGSDNKIGFMKIDLDEKIDVLAYHKKLLAEALKEKGDLETKFENWHNSSKNLSRMINTQMSANDKFRLGYGDYIYGSFLSYENEVLQIVFMNKASDLEDTHVNDRFANEMDAVPPPMTGNYMPSGLDVEIDYSKFTYGLKQNSADESDSKPSEYASCESDCSVETSMPEPVKNALKVLSERKVWTDAPIIEEYESNGDNDLVSNVQEDKEKPSFAFTNSVKHVKISKENIKKTGTTNQSLKIEKQDRNGHTRKGLGYAFTRKACFVYSSFNHLIRDYDFHEKKMAKQVELTKSKNKVIGQRENRPVWNNVQRVNHQNKLGFSRTIAMYFQFCSILVRELFCSTQFNFHHDDNFVTSPLMYHEEDESTIHDIDFKGMIVARLSKMLQGTCMFPVKGIFFLVLGKELSNGLIQIKNDLDLANCISIIYKNGKVIDMFLEHHGYDLSHWIQTDIDNNDDEIYDVEMEDITGDKPDVGESSQPCGKELEINSDDEDVGKQFKLVDGDLAEGRSDGKKGKKEDWPYKKEKDKDELPKKDKGKLLRAPKKGTKKVCKRAKQRALFDHEGGLIKQYSRLWDYKKQLLDMNPGLSVHLHVDEKDDGKIYFKRIYIYFMLMIEGWSAGCRKVIGFDGCFLKGTCRGELLTAMGRDGNNQMFPIAWVVGAAASTVQHNFFLKMILIGNIDLEAKQWLVDRNPNRWCRAFFKIDRGCAAYENGISESYHNSIRIARDSITPSIRKEIKHLKHSQRYWIVYPCGNNVFKVRKGDDSYGVNIENRTCACKWWDLSGVPCMHSVAAFSFLKNDPILEPPLPQVLRKMPGRTRKLRIKHVTKRVNVITKSGRMMTCHNCWEKGHNKKGCKKEKQPKPTVEKRAPGRKKADSDFVFQTCNKDGGDAYPSSASPSVVDPSSVGLSVAYPSSTSPSVADPSSAGPSVVDSSSAGPSVAYSTGSGTQTITEDPIVADPTDDIPT